MTQLHSAVKKLAGDNPALVFSLDAFRGFLINNFAEAIKHLRNKSVQIEGFPTIEARFTQLTVDPDQFMLSLSDVDGFVVAEESPGFTVTIALHVAGKTAFEFSRIEIDVANLKVKLIANAPNLLLSTPDFDVKGKVTPSSSRDDALSNYHIQEDDLERIEGAMAYVMPRRVVASALSTMRSIDLAKHFPAFDLRGDWALHIVKDGLVIIPSGGIVIRENTDCPIKDSAPNLDLSIPQNSRNSTDDTHYSWPINSKGAPELKVRNVNHRDDGFVALYAPKPIWDARFAKVMPAIVYRESDNGFIGYDLTFTAGLSYVELTIDPARFGIVVDLSLEANGYAFLTVDVPCVGRSDLAYARFSCASSDLSILLSFVLQPSGKLVLDSQIDKLNIGPMDAEVYGFSRWLALAGGKAAVIGFIIDYILKRVIEHNVPIKIRDAIKQELNSKNFEILDLEELATFTKYRRFDSVTFSGDNNSVLVGLTSAG